MRRQASTTRDDFEEWLASMEDFIEQFIEEFPEEEQDRLDYSPESLDIAEAWILETYSDTSTMIASDQSRSVNRVACYIGQTYRKALGGKWDICLNDPDFAFFGIPIIRGPSYEDCPLSLATATADRRTGSYLRTVLENKLRRISNVS